MTISLDTSIGVLKLRRCSIFRRLFSRQCESTSGEPKFLLVRMEYIKSIWYWMEKLTCPFTFYLIVGFDFILYLTRVLTLPSIHGLLLSRGRPILHSFLALLKSHLFLAKLIMGSSSLVANADYPYFIRSCFSLLYMLLVDYFILDSKIHSQPSIYTNCGIYE